VRGLKSIGSSLHDWKLCRYLIRAMKARTLIVKAVLPLIRIISD